MEEVIAKSVRKNYIVSYSIFLAVGLIFSVVGILAALNVEEQDAAIFGWILFSMGIVLMIGGIAWLIYFIKMPSEIIKLKDGKLYFKNGVVCSPTEVENYQSKIMGIDGLLFGYGKLFISVNGKQFKLKFVKEPDNVVQRLFMLKAEYQIKENIANNQNATTEVNPAENNI